MARATTSRGARSPAGIVALDEALARGVEQTAAFAAQRLRQQEPRRAGDARAPSDGTARTRGRPPAPRPRTPSPCRRRSPPPGSWFRGTPARRRPWPAASASATTSCTSPDAIDEGGARAHAVVHAQRSAPSPRRARARAATSTRASTARGRSRGRWRRGRAAPGARCARPRVRAPARPASSRSKAAPQSSSSLHVARAVLHEHVDRLAAAQPVARLHRVARVQLPASRRGRPPRRRRPARSRCCSRPDRPW